MRELAFVLWVALIGADRIDLLGGEGPIVLTPFYVLTPLVLWGEALRRRRAGGTLFPTLPLRGSAYAAGVLVLLAVAALSVLVSRDVTTSVGRLVLLTAIACGTGLVFWSVWDDPRWGERLARGGRWGIAIAMGFSMLQVAEFLGWLPSEWMVGPIRVRLDPYTYAGILPRVSGVTFDPNRAGLVLLTHWAVLARTGRPRAGWRGLTIALLLGTLSRSALLAAGAYLLVQYRSDVVLTARRRAPGLGAVLLAGLLAISLLMAPTRRERLGRFLSPVAQRLSTAEGSAESHGSLMRQGLAEATRDVPRTMVGVGYGTSFLLLRDRFGGDRYGNFHSLYLTLWVESGMVALLLMLLLLLAPLRRATEWRALLLGAILFNVFYQSIAEATFWAILALAWSAPPLPSLTRPR